MEKRYQVFISSTFQDLQNARQEVSQALLRADCFPAGMELFPAADEEQFAFIKTVIDQSDYYIIISAGRYGSIHPETGLSYTEMEYDYAVEIGKPIVRLLHRDPLNELKGQFIESSDEGRANLSRFREKLSSRRLVKYWSSEQELGSAVDHGLRHLTKLKPAVGWVRSDQVGQALELENYRLKERIRQLIDAQEKPLLVQSLSFETPVLANTVDKLTVGEIPDEVEAIYLTLGELFRFKTILPANLVVTEISSLIGLSRESADHVVNALILDGALLQKADTLCISDEAKLTMLKIKALRFFSDTKTPPQSGP